MRGWGVHRGGMHGKGEGAYVAGETTSAADGTHPTGMHSCLAYNSLQTGAPSKRVASQVPAFYFGGCLKSWCHQ